MSNAVSQKFADFCKQIKHAFLANPTQNPLRSGRYVASTKMTACLSGSKLQTSPSYFNFFAEPPIRMNSLLSIQHAQLSKTPQIMFNKRPLPIAECGPSVSSPITGLNHSFCDSSHVEFQAVFWCWLLTKTPRFLLWWPSAMHFHWNLTCSCWDTESISGSKCWMNTSTSVLGAKTESCVRQRNPLQSQYFQMTDPVAGPVFPGQLFHLSLFSSSFTV